MPEKNVILNCWKEIAAYMGRGVRTVQRWERDLRLPVHRPKGRERSAVIAFPEELDGWLHATPVRGANGHDERDHSNTSAQRQTRELLQERRILQRDLVSAMNQLRDAAAKLDSALREGMANADKTQGSYPARGTGNSNGTA